MPEICCAFHLYVPGRCSPALPTFASGLSSSWDTLSTTGAGVGGVASPPGLSPPQPAKPRLVDSPTPPHPTTRRSRCGCAMNDRSNVAAFSHYHQSVLRCAEWVAQVRQAQDDDAGGGLWLGEGTTLVIDFDHDNEHEHRKHLHRRSAGWGPFLPPGPSTAATVIAMNTTERHHHHHHHHHRRSEDDDGDDDGTETETHDEHDGGSHAHAHIAAARPRTPGGPQQPHRAPTAPCSCGNPLCPGGPVQLRTPAPAVCACDDVNCPGGRLALDRGRGGASTSRD